MWYAGVFQIPYSIVDYTIDNKPMKNTPAYLLDVFVYTLVDEYLKAGQHRETGCSAIGRRPKLGDTEVLFVALMSLIKYRGNLSKSQQAMYRYDSIKQVLDKSQLRCCKTL